MVLEVGDSVYFDASMAHRYLTAGENPTRMLCVYSHLEHARLDHPGEVQAHSLAMRILGGHMRSEPANASEAAAPVRPAAKVHRRCRG